MRLVLRSALVAAALALTGAVAAAAPAPSAIATSAERFGLQAAYHGPEVNLGYSARSRRMTACLATYPGVYDPRTDLVRLRPGVTRRCSL